MFSFELTCDGKTVEPEGTVTVQIDLEKGLTAGKVNAAWRVFHFKNDGSINEITEDDNSLNLISSGKVLNSIEFKTDSFSAYAVTSVSSKLVLMRAAKNALPLSLNDNKNEGYVTGASFYVMTKEGKRVDNPESVNDGDDIYLTLNYKIPKGVKLSDHDNQVTYQFDDHLKAVMEDSGNIIDKTDNSKILGAYMIDKNGLVTLTFTNEDCLNGTRDVTGDFTYHARVENSDTKKDHSITIAGTGTTINIKAKEEDLQINKSKPVASYTDDGKIQLHYTVEATSSTETSYPVTFTDTPTVYNYDNVTISNPKAYYIDSTSSDYNSGNGIPIEQSGNKVTTHQSLDSSHKIVLVYDIIIDPKKINLANNEKGTFGINNSVEGTAGKAKGNSNSSFWYDGFISKDGYYQNGKLYWQVIVDKFKEGPITITDQLGDGLKNIDTANFKKYISSDGTTWNWTDITSDVTAQCVDDTGKYRITFSGAPGKYKIEYCTDLSDNISRDTDQTVNNTASYNGGSANKSVTVTREISSPTMTKSGPNVKNFTASDGKELKKLSWTINIKLPNSIDKLSEFTLSDYFSASDKNNQSIIKAHYSNIDNFDLKYDHNINSSDFAVSYLDQSISVISNAGSSNFYGFKIEFSKEQLQKLHEKDITEFNISYNTIADIASDVIENYEKPIIYKNTADIGGPRQEKHYEYSDSKGSLYKSSSFSSNANHSAWGNSGNIYRIDSTGIINWADPYVYYRIIANVGAGTSTPVTINDDLPITLDANTVTVDVKSSTYFDFRRKFENYIEGQDKNWPLCNFTVNWDGDKKAFTITPDEEAFKDDYIAIYYKVKLSADAISQLKNSEALDITNTAKWNGNPSSSTVHASYQKLKKGAVYDNTKDNQTITYSLIVNPSAAVLNSGNIITLTDTLNEHDSMQNLSASFDESYGVKFYDYNVLTGSKGSEKKGNGISDNYSYNYVDSSNGHILTIRIPDSTALLVSYRYTIRDIGNIAQDADVTNNVSMTGGYSDSTKTEKLTQDSLARAYTNGLTVYKIRTLHAEIKIPGVKFTLSQYDGNDWKPIYGQSTPLVTDRDGKFGIPVGDKIQVTQLYKLTEIENNNSGYGSWSQGTINHYIVFVDNNDISKKNDEIWKSVLHPESISVSDVIFVRRSQRLDISNDYTKLNIRKVWQDSDGKDISNGAEVSGKTVTVQLTRMKKAKSGGDYASDTSFGTGGKLQYTLDSVNHWTVGITETVLNEDSNYDYLYKVTEISDSTNTSDTADYTISYKTLDGSGNFIDIQGDGIKEGTLVVINKKKSISYNLPSTGGNGSTPFVLTGFVMTSLAALMYIYRRRISGRGGAQ